MGKKISELSPELQEVCHQRQLEQGNDGKFIGSLGDCAGVNNFDWDKTLEDYTFWANINDGKDMTNDPLYPKRDKVVTDYSIF